MNSGLGGASKGMRGYLGTGQAMAGRGLMSAGRYAQKNPRATMGIAAGVAGAGAMGMKNRGSQNYPMY